jgi:hypothetical protein
MCAGIVAMVAIESHQEYRCHVRRNDWQYQASLLGLDLRSIN